MSLLKLNVHVVPLCRQPQPIHDRLFFDRYERIASYGPHFLLYSKSQSTHVYVRDLISKQNQTAQKIF